MRTLDQNIFKLRMVSAEIERLSNPDSYYRTDIGRGADKANRKHLRNAMRSLRRLTIVVQKQSQSRIQTLYPWFKYGHSSSVTIMDAHSSLMLPPDGQRAL